MVQMTNKKGFSRCGELYIDRLREEGRYSTAHVYKNALFLSVCFVVRVMCRSGKSPVRACGFTGSIFTRMG